MGQDEELLAPDPLDHGCGDDLGREHLARRLHRPRGQRAHAVRVGLEHRRRHAHRADGADADTARAVGDREPLGERHRRVLAHRVGRRPDLGQQPRRRRRRDEVALAALQPPGQQQLRGGDVGAQVDVEHRVPHGVGGLDGVRAGTDARVREVDVDRAHLVQQRGGRLGVGDVEGAGHRGALHRRRVAVGGHHAGAGLGERGDERPPDPPAGPGDDGRAISQLH